MSKREVMYALENRGIPVTVKGEGWAVFQFPPADTEITDETTVYLEFK